MEFNYLGYELKFIQCKRIVDQSAHLYTFIYKFYSPITKLQYILLADYHDNDFFALKFYPKPFRKSTKVFVNNQQRGLREYCNYMSKSNPSVIGKIPNSILWICRSTVI